MKFRFATWTAPPVEPTDTVIPEPTPLIDGKIETTADQAAYVRHLFGVRNPDAFRAFAELTDPRQMEAALVVLEQRRDQAQAAALVFLADLPALDERIARGQAMIDAADDPPADWRALLHELVGQRARIAAAALAERETVMTAENDYGAFLSWYQLRIGGDALEEYADTPEAS